MQRMKHRLTAAGDLLILRELPQGGSYEGFEPVRSFLEQGDFRFANLEATIHRYECPPSEESGGSWICAAPEVLNAVQAFGFNVLSLANNHTLDFSQEGVIKTKDYVQQAGFKAAGTGRTLAEASEPVYFEGHDGRYALIAASSSFKPDAMAGAQSSSMMGRPGLNGIRHTERFRIRKEQMEMLKDIAQETAINGYKDIIRKEGYLPAIPENEFDFGGIRFEESETVSRVSEVNEQDMKRVEQAIFDARLQADVIAVSIHAHEISGTRKEDPDQFLQEFAHRCIEAGAHVVIGHGPHLLRPIELYKGRPIFYSLGDFILQNENIRRGPAQWFKSQGLSPDATMHELFATRSAQFTRGLQTDPVMFEAVIPYWELEDGQLTKLDLMPVELGFGRPRSIGGWPMFAPDRGIIERLAEMSGKFGTQIDIENGIGRVLI